MFLCVAARDSYIREIEARVVNQLNILAVTALAFSFWHLLPYLPVIFLFYLKTHSSKVDPDSRH